jgi:hypothetical protein
MESARSDEDEGRAVTVRVRSGGTSRVVVSAEDYERVRRHEWVEKSCGTVVRRFAKGGRRREQTLAQFVLGETSRCVFKRNGDPRDFRKGNLVESRGVSIRFDARQPRRPFVVRVKIGDAGYSGGSWPLRWMAEAAAGEIERALPRLVGRGYERAYIQQQISQAAGWPSSGRRRSARVVFVADAGYVAGEV